MDRSDCVIDIGPEQLLWLGRPAPRCYTLRHWRGALCWGVVCLCATILQIWMWQAWSIVGAWSMAFLPAPLLLLAFALSFGRLFYARLEWEHIFYSMSDTCVRIQRGRRKRVACYLYAEIQAVRLELYRDNAPTGLGWVHVEFGKQQVTLECLEDAQRAYSIITEQLHRQVGK